MASSVLVNMAPCLQDRQFIDWKRVVVKGGNGGDGCVTFRRYSRVVQVNSLM